MSHSLKLTKTSTRNRYQHVQKTYENSSFVYSKSSGITSAYRKCGNLNVCGRGNGFCRRPPIYRGCAEVRHQHTRRQGSLAKGNCRPANSLLRIPRAGGRRTRGHSSADYHHADSRSIESARWHHHCSAERLSESRHCSCAAERNGDRR